MPKKRPRFCITIQNLIVFPSAPRWRLGSDWENMQEMPARPYSFERQRWRSNDFKMQSQHFGRLLIQWAVRPIDSCHHNRKLHDIHVDCNPVSFRELMSAIDQLKNGKQPGSDDVPSEFWKAISSHGSNTCNWVLFFFQSI